MESDLPSYDELENIFSSPPNTTARKFDDYRLVLEPRSGIDTDSPSISENDSKLDELIGIPTTDTYTSGSQDESIPILQTVITEEDAAVSTTNVPEPTLWDIITRDRTASLQSRSDVQTNDNTLAETETNTETETSGPLETTTDNFSN